MNNSEKIWHALGQNKVDKIAFNPCNKLNLVMKYVPKEMEVWDITKESGGLALCFGRSLGGKRSAMFIQNTGLGNLVTELYTMQKLYQEGLPIFASFRGYFQEPIEAQIIYGSNMERLLGAIDVEYRILEKSEDLLDLEEDVANCFAEKKVKVYLLSPELWEERVDDYHVFGQPKFTPVTVNTEAYDGNPTQIRAEAIQVIMDNVGSDDVVLSQIGFPSKEVYNANDRAENFYMLGALGSATEVGIGLADALEDRHVYIVDGDGSFFFNPNQLVDLAAFKPKNLTVICLDNGSYGSTGNQPTLSSSGMNLSSWAQTMGIERTGITDEPEAFAELLKEKPSFIHYLIKAGNKKTGDEIPLKAVEIKQRFMDAVL
ncbi:MAG: thiamine pyrophosphate-dependent enzyme [Oceanospirillaceae bacterium]